MKPALLAGLAALCLAVAACATTTVVAGDPAPTTMQPATPLSSSGSSTAAPAPAAASASPVATASPTASPTATKAAPNMCAGNSKAQLVLVVIRVQHAWMCSHATLVYQTPVTTGAVVDDDDTPTGTWHVQSVQGARYLTLKNGTRYHVNYWIPYDDIYGFHDAAWQTFPEGSPLYKTQGSHGCVHLPTAAMAWLSKWVEVGATVTVRSA